MLFRYGRLAIQVVQAFPVCHNPNDSSDVNARTETAVRIPLASVVVYYDILFC